MKDFRHDWIQRWSEGHLNTAEVLALQEALQEDPALRAWYLDYMNLDATLLATARSASNQKVPTPLARFAPTAIVQPRRGWPWAVAAGLVAGLAALVALRSDPKRPAPDIIVATSTAHEAINRARIQTPPTLPAWMSPTQSLLSQYGTQQ